MLDAATRTALAKMKFCIRRQASGLWAGRHLTARTGQGADFHDYRAYSPGDDIARLDWKLLGRTDRHYIRRDRDLSQLDALLLLDVSASMNFASLDAQGQRQAQGPPTKLRFAASLAAALSFVLLRQQDRVALMLLDRGVSASVPLRGGPVHLQRILRTLEQVKPAAGQGDLPVSLAQAAARWRAQSSPEGAVVLLSDMLDDPADLLRGLEAFRPRRRRVIAMQVLSEAEWNWGQAMPARSLRLVDAESRQSMPVHIPALASEHDRLVHEHVQRIRTGCRAMGIEHELALTSRRIEQVLAPRLERA